jgi:hypothetical protein
MKKIALLWILLSTLMLTGCSMQQVKDKFNELSNWVMQKDQQQEQWFTVTTELLEEKLYKEQWYLDLSKLWLTAVPDICKLMKPEDLTLIQIINLAQNRIRIVDQDLSCLTNLRVLNMSYNEIVDVARLGALPSLQELMLHKNKIESIEKLIGMDLPALEKLNLAYNKLKEIDSLGKLTNLIVLELQHNVLEKLVGVENLKKLEDLKLEFNKLKDIPFLEQLEKLKSITTEWNELKETIEWKIKELQDKFNKMKDAAQGVPVPSATE